MQALATNFADEGALLGLCPICKVNYITDEEKYCETCVGESDLSEEELDALYGGIPADEEGEEELTDDDDDDDADDDMDDDMEMLSLDLEEEDEIEEDGEVSVDPLDDFEEVDDLDDEEELD